MAQFDAGTYGRSFADVYDDWYPPDERTDACVAFLSALAPSRARVLELGVGTGRLALPLADAGHDVTGIDASAEMVACLRAKDLHGAVRAVEADVGAPSTWPEEHFDLVVAVCNLLCNLTDTAEQAACIAGAADRLAPDGHLVVEAFEPAPLVPGPQLATSEVCDDSVVLIATDADPATSVVHGAHVELRDGEPVRVRPWRIRATTVTEIDGWATASGLELVGRTRSWGEDGPPSDGLVSVYRRPT